MIGCILACWLLFACGLFRGSPVDRRCAGWVDDRDRVDMEVIALLVTTAMPAAEVAAPC